MQTDNNNKLIFEFLQDNVNEVYQFHRKINYLLQ